jgi:hypothetical protein
VRHEHQHDVHDDDVHDNRSSDARRRPQWRRLGRFAHQDDAGA